MDPGSIPGTSTGATLCEHPPPVRAVVAVSSLWTAPPLVFSGTRVRVRNISITGRMGSVGFADAGDLRSRLREAPYCDAPLYRR
jgi:hypothetical protein